MTGDSATQQLIAAAVVLAQRQRDSIREVAVESGYISIGKDGHEFVVLPGSNDKYPLSDLSVVVNAVQFLELIGRVVDIKVVLETWRSIGDSRIVPNEAIITWLDSEAAKIYRRPKA